MRAYCRYLGIIIQNVQDAGQDIGGATAMRLANMAFAEGDVYAHRCVQCGLWSQSQDARPRAESADQVTHGPSVLRPGSCAAGEDRNRCGGPAVLTDCRLDEHY